MRRPKGGGKPKGGAGGVPRCYRCGGQFEAGELTPIVGAYGLFAVFCKGCFEKERSERAGPGRRAPPM